MELPKPLTTRICCIGAGYVGGPTCAVIAQQNPHIEVTVVDLDEVRIAQWKSSNLPIFEPGLSAIVEVARDGTDGRKPNLFFSTAISPAIQQADIIFIAVNTPTKRMGVGAGSASDLGYVESAARMIANAATTDKIIVEKSTVPCGTAERLRSIFQSLAPARSFSILSNPEFLAEGTAIKDLLNPDRVLIGSLKDDHSMSAAQELASVYSWVPHDRVVHTNLYSSELAKLAANCLLAQRISSINSLSAICEATGADISEVANAVSLDQRIGKHMLKASAGFGGSCFKKDVLSLVYIAESLHLYDVANYWRAVNSINEHQKSRFTSRVISALHGTLLRKKITIFGWAYKKNTGDTRESASISVATQLLAEGCELAVYDPQVSTNAQQIYRDLENVEASIGDRVRVYDNALDACVDACAVLILTEWDHFKTDMLADTSALPEDCTAASSDSGIDVSEDGTDVSTTKPVVHEAFDRSDRVDWCAIASVVQRPRLVFDGRGIVDPAPLGALGFRVESIGKASMT